MPSQTDDPELEGVMRRPLNVHGPHVVHPASIPLRDSISEAVWASLLALSVSVRIIHSKIRPEAK